MRKKLLKIVLMTVIGVIFGALLGYLGQCAGST